MQEAYFLDVHMYLQFKLLKIIKLILQMYVNKKNML